MGRAMVRRMTPGFPAVSAGIRQSELAVRIEARAGVHLIGQQQAMPAHAGEFKPVSIPVTLHKGGNQMLIDTSKRRNPSNHHRAIQCAHAEPRSQ